MCLAQALFLSPPVSPQSPPGMEIAGWDKVGSPFLSPEKCARAFSLLSQQETNKAHPSSQVHKSISHSPRKCPFLSYLISTTLSPGTWATLPRAAARGRASWPNRSVKESEPRERKLLYVPWQEPRGAWIQPFRHLGSTRAWEQACMHNPKRDQKRGLPAAGTW